MRSARRASLENGAGKAEGQVIRELILVALLAIVTAAAIHSLMQGSGFLLVAVEGHSMQPLFYSGDIVVVEKVKPDEIHVGDIIVYRGCGGRLIIHRVYKVCSLPGVGYCYVTWGDNNPVPDTPAITCSPYTCHGMSCVPYNQVLGKVTGPDNLIYKIPFIGGVSLYR